MPADPVLARRLAEVGCATVMPLASPIGSGRGILNRASLEIIVEEATVPVVVDAGLGVPSEAAAAMEMGADAVLVNTAIAESRDPVAMAGAFRKAVEAGRGARLAGRMAHASVCVDMLDDGETTREFSVPRIPGPGSAHGTGCMLSSAIAALMARGADLAQACAEAQSFVAESIRQGAALRVGHGAGPEHQLGSLWARPDALWS